MSNESMTLAELLKKKGEEIGVSDWMTVSQDRINGFADVTEDHQFIHLDVESVQKRRHRLAELSPTGF